MTALYVVAAVWLLPGFLFVAWLVVDSWLDGLADLHDWDTADGDWLDDLIDLCFVRWENELADGERA